MESAFDVEDTSARIAPDIPLHVTPAEKPFSVIDQKRGVVYPHCAHASMMKLGKSKRKKVYLSVLLHPEWLAGAKINSVGGHSYGGAAQDDAISTGYWNEERARTIRLLEVRGELPDEVTCPKRR